MKIELTDCELVTELIKFISFEQLSADMGVCYNTVKKVYKGKKVLSVAERFYLSAKLNKFVSQAGNKTSVESSNKGSQ